MGSKLICIDPGHGGSDPGAVGVFNGVEVREADVTLCVAALLQNMLLESGHLPLLTRYVDQYESPRTKANDANRQQCDLFISLHCNSHANKSATGIEVFHFTGSKAAKRPATLIMNSLSREFSAHKQRGVKEANFAVLRETHMPAVLVEMEFISNPTKCRFLCMPSNQYRYAKAIHDGVIKYFDEVA